MSRFDLSKTEEKRQKLEQISKELKSEFFGLDDIINRIIDTIQCWYVLPEIINRPVIVNLWGLTGVGKTQVVRSLVKKLGFADKFVEVQMDGFSNGSGYNKDSICSILQSSSVEEGQYGVLLLDEFQRFRTIDMQGADIEVKRFQDVWMLLSDGRFSGDYSLFKELESSLAYDNYYDDETSVAVKDKKAEKLKRKRKYHTSVWQAKLYKKLLKLKEPITELMTWPKEEFSARIMEFLKNKTSNEIDYSKLLIFICGNLDEAFQGVAGSVSDSDTDADIFHMGTKEVSVFKIKNALKTRFKPEQIARLGSNHIIYPSLSKSSYESLIRSACDKYITETYKTTGVKLNIADEVYKIVYDNAVFPTQGTRPVFSAVHSILSSSVTNFALWALKNKIKEAKVSINLSASTISCEAKNKTSTLPVVLEIKQQKDKNSIDFNTLVAVHEAGHALVESVLTNRAPCEIKINIASFKGGFNMIRNEDSSIKRDTLNHISVLLAGSVAEEIVFGEGFRSTGNIKDNRSATHLAAEYIRDNGFGEISSYVMDPKMESHANHDIEITNPLIEKLIKTQRVHASKIIHTNIRLLKDIVNKLLKDSVITDDQFIELAKSYIPQITKVKRDVTHPFSEKWNEFNAKP